MQQPPTRPLALLAWALKPTSGGLAILILTLLGVWICELAIPLLLGRTVDAAISKSGGPAEIYRLGAATLFVSALLYGLHTVYLRAETQLVARGTFRLRQHLYTRLFEQQLSFFGAAKKGEIAHRLMSDPEVLDAHAIYLLADVPFSLLTVLGTFAVMLWMQPVLAVLVSGVLAAVALLAQRVARPLAPLERSLRHSWARLGGRLQETLDAIRTIKTFGGEAFEMQRLDHAGTRLMRGELATGQVIAHLEPLMQLLTTFGFITVVWSGAALVFQGALTPGKLVAFIAYMELLREPILNAGTSHAHYRQSLTSLSRIADFLKQLMPPHHRGSICIAGPLSVEVEDLHFAHPGGPPILAGVSLSASAGETVAIVGPNGAGKSTLLDLLLGLRSPDRGTVRIGGVPVEQWSPEALRRAAGAVPQDSFLFHATIEENVRYGAPDANDVEMEMVIDQAGLSATIARLPSGRKTVVGDRGERLSGGERQRVALARALLRNPRLLILDEPTSAIDEEAFPDLLQKLHGGRNERVTIVVTHDRRTILHADRVIVLANGRVERVCAPSEYIAEQETRRVDVPDERYLGMNHVMRELARPKIAPPSPNWGTPRWR